MAVFVVGLLGSLGAGALLQAVGWQMLNLLLLPWLLSTAAALVGLAWTRRRRMARAARS